MQIRQLHSRKSLQTFNKTLIFVLLFHGCATRVPPEQPKVREPVAVEAVEEIDRVERLAQELDSIFSDVSFENAFWGVMVQSVETGEILYRRNHNKLLMPASTMKIVVGAVSLKELGGDFRFQTVIAADGPITNGVLRGNLLVIGGGDPTIADRFNGGDATTVFRTWANTLRTAGITRINGDIIGITEVFDDKRLGHGWSWEDLPYGYAAEVSALQFNENVFTVTVKATQPGKPVTIIRVPETEAITVRTDIAVTNEEANLSAGWRRIAGTNSVEVSGTLGRNDSDYGTFSISDPASFFLHVFKETLEKSEIEVAGEAITRMQSPALPDSLQTLIRHESPPLSEILAVMLKVSQNLYAETLLKTLGRIRKEQGSFEAGLKVVEESLEEFGVPPNWYILADGSGLSRHNYLTPEMLVVLLRGMHKDEKFALFYEALPLAGKEGTLKARMKGTKAEGNVRAKTGSISNVRALSGYTATMDGELLAFAMIANNFKTPREAAEYVQDLALERLAHFTRK